MNLRVDLILESEQRSGSLLSPKSLIRIAIVIFPTILGLVLATAAYKTWQLSAERRQLEQQLKTTSNRQQEAKDLQKTLQLNENIFAKMNWWHNSQLEWAKLLVGLQKLVPPTVQFTTLSLPEKIGGGTKPSRNFDLVLTGKAVGKEARENVKKLADDIVAAPEFKNLIDSSKITDFRQDTDKGAKEDDRTFRIECKFKPRT